MTDDNVIDLGGKPKAAKKRLGRSMMKETPADNEVRQSVLENSGRRLLEIVEGLENLADRMADLRADVKTRIDAAKSEGYSPAAIRALIKRRAASPEAIKAQEELMLVVDTYADALGAVE